MKYVNVLIVAFISLMIIGCEKDIYPNSACDLTFRGENWVPTTNSQNFGCAFYLEKYAYKGRFYYSRGSHCADVSANIASCDNENLCETNAKLCNQVIEKGEYLGIIAFLDE